MIREATHEDLDGIAELLKFAHDESPNYERFGYSENRTRAYLHNFRDSLESTMLVNEKDGEIVGLAMGVLQPNWLSFGYVAVSVLIYSKPGHNGIPLVKGFLSWAKSWKKVTKVQIQTSFKGERGERANRLMERLGLEPVGTQFTGEV